MSTVQIGDARASRAPEYPEDADRRANLAVFHFDTLTVRCAPTRPAIEAIAAKYRKARPHKVMAGPKRQPSTRRGYSKTWMASLIEDGDIDNAIEYAQSFPEGKLCVNGQRLLRHIKEWRAA